MSRHVKSGNACKRTLECAGVEKQIAKKGGFHHHSFFVLSFSQFNEGKAGLF